MRVKRANPGSLLCEAKPDSAVIRAREIVREKRLAENGASSKTAERSPIHL